jgi:hypothetical protein
MILHVKIHAGKSGERVVETRGVQGHTTHSVAKATTVNPTQTAREGHETLCNTYL